jgi:predicted enzyme related to lactoylglutathione lyase
MSQGIGVVVYPVADVGAAKELYAGLLGVEPYADQPYYVGFKVGDQEIGLDPNGHENGLTGPTVFFRVDDIWSSLHSLAAAGAQTDQDPTDVGGGRLIARVGDADGNTIGLMQG